MKRVFSHLLLILSLTTGTSQEIQASVLCAKNIDCKGGRLCERGQCSRLKPQINLAANLNSSVDLAPPASSIAYKPIPILGNKFGPFTINGNQIDYPSGAGAVDVFEQVIDEPEYAVYVQVEKAYSFGPTKFVLVISTGEGGNSCPATTYVVSFDTQTESIDGKTTVDGCSEEIDSLADGNKLIVKKDGASTEIYNGLVR